MLTIRTVLRDLRRRWLTAVMVVATIAVCGASLTIGYVVSGPAFRGLSYEQSRDLYVVAEKSQDGRLSATLSLDGLALLERLPVKAHAEARPISGVTTSIGGSTIELRGVEVSESLLPLLGARPYLGRLADAHGLLGTAPAVVVTFRFWKAALNARSDAIGQPFSTSAGDCTVAAVLAPDFVFPWTGQVQPDVLFVTPIVSGTAAAFVKVSPERFPSQAVLGSLALLPFQQYLLGGFTGAATAVFIGFSVLAVALSTTLYLLFLVLQAPRRSTQELLVALGRPARTAAAERATEVLLVASLGFVPAYWLAALGTTTIVEQIPQREILRSAIVLGPLEVLYGFGTTLILVLLAYWTATASALRRRAPGALTARPAGTRTLSLVASAQVAVAVTLLTVAVALGKSVLPMVMRDLGFDPNNLYISDPIGPSGLTSGPERYLFMSGVIDRLRQHKGVIDVAGIDSFPPSGALPDRALLAEAALPREARGAVWRVTPNYFSVMRMTLTAGRTFTEAEVDGKENVCVLSSSAAARVLHPPLTLGSEVTIGTTRCRTVGVVQDAVDSLRGSSWWGVYLPFDPQAFRRLTIVSRAAISSEALAAAAAAAYRTPERRIPSRTVAVRSLLASRVGELGLLTACLQVATLIVLCLCIGGTYGIASAQLAAHRRVHAVQMALGARYRHLAVSLLQRVSWPIARGALVGAVAGAQYQGYVASLMSDVTPLPASHLAWACAALMLAAIAGAALVARSSARANLRPLLDEQAGFGR